MGGRKKTSKSKGEGIPRPREPSAGDGECKRAAEATVPINDKMIVLGLQAHNHWGGLISYFNADRGGQAYAYKPELP